MAGGKKQPIAKPLEPVPVEEPEVVPEPEVKSPRATHDKKAADCEVGETKDVDGVIYIVKADKNGLKKWLKQKSEEPKEKKVKEPKEKKRAPTAYNLYVKKMMAEIREKDQSLAPTQYMVMAVNMWKALSDDEKAEIKKELVTEM